MLNPPIRDHMLVDPALQQEIVRLIDSRGPHPNQPERAADLLGLIVRLDGTRVPVYLRHAADPILLDCAGYVVLITRRNNPGARLRALPGGFLDPVPNGEGGFGVEQAVAAAMREAMEETGVSKAILIAADVTPVRRRSFDRPFDLREAWRDIPDTAILKGDLFAVSTQGFSFHIKRALSTVSLHAGDDATYARVKRISELRLEQFAVPDHLPMITQALETCCKH